MVLEEDPNILIQEIGHDGMEKIWPEHPAPMCYRSHHMQEIIDCFVTRGLGLMLIEGCPMQASSINTKPFKTFNYPQERLLHHIEDREAIIICKGHACAWDGTDCYDPNGHITSITDYEIIEAWIKVEMI
jgi:hypothetical protein